MDVLEPTSSDAPARTRQTAKDGLSYKFQRLRERLRSAVASGELSGKLPGERTLARRFHVNAKTLSKALTDLAAEGLLDRSIGRGTYVKSSSAPVGADPAKAAGRWLIVSDAHRAASPLLDHFRQASPDAAVITEITSLRPSFLRQFSAVIDFAVDTPESFLRDLIVRNIPVVAVNREPNLYSINTVATDRALGANHLTRDLILGGHSHVAVVEAMPRSVVGRAVKQAALRYGPEALVRISRVDEVLAATQAGATAIICDSVGCAGEVRSRLEASGMNIPQDVSLCTIGCSNGSYPCSGQFVDCGVTAQAVAEVIGGTGNSQRPTTIWLAPRWVDCGTTGKAPGLDSEGEAA
jgi:hypothetical protein